MSEPRPPSDAEVACANCGRSFRGAYCPDCGQLDADLDRPVRHFLRDALGDLFDIDARMWRTAPMLVARPGRLAADYAAGKRARYVAPFRLYLLLGAAFFTVLALAGGGPFRFEAVEIQGGVMIVSPFGIQVGATGAELASRRSVTAGVGSAALNVDRLNAVVVATLSYVHLLLLPVLALYLAALWRRRWYLEHLVFATYYGAFALLAGTVMVAAYALAGNPRPDGLAAQVAVGAWEIACLVTLYRALREMYGDGRKRTLVRTLGLAVAYFVTAAAAVTGIAIATVLLVY